MLVASVTVEGGDAEGVYKAAIEGITERLLEYSR